MRPIQPTNNKESGFTIVELLTVIVLIPLIISAFIFVLYDLVSDGSGQALQLSLNDRAQTAANWLEKDIRYSGAFNEVIPNGTGYVDPNQPSDGWKFTGSSADSRVLILTAIATSQNLSSTSRSAVYTKSPVTDCSSSQITLNQPLNFYIVYFVNSGTLYRRIIPNTDVNTPRCGEQSQKLSCPANQLMSNSACKARDEVVATDVSQFSVDYYQATNNSNYIYDANPLNADDIKIIDSSVVTLKLSRKNGSTTISATQTIREPRLNKLGGSL